MRDDASLGGFAAYDAKNKPRTIDLVSFVDMKPRLGGHALIKGVLEREQISLIMGLKQTGKTFLALDLSLHIAGGLKWFGRRVYEGAVVYVAAEAGRSIVNRVCAWKFAHGYDDDAVIPFFAVTSSIDLCHADVGDVDRLITTIRNACKEGVVLVVVDTVSRALAGGDENSPGDMGAIVCSLDRLRDEFNCHVLAVHHLGKDATRGARGHSLLTCNLDTVIEVTRDEASKISSAVIKNQRDGPLGGQFDFQLRPVELGRDEDLDPVTSCVVEAAGGDTPTPRPKHVPLSAKLQIALDTLDRTIAAHGQQAPPHNHIPTTATVVSLDLWRRFYLAGTIVSEGNSEDTRRKAWRRAGEELQKRRIIQICDEIVWKV